MDKENLHSGHRERVIEKFINNPKAFSEHEVLELLLFYSIPRKNTNDIAHRLLRAFGSLDNVFSATASELMAVNGVGKKTATLIMLTGKIILVNNQTKKPKKTLFSLQKVKEIAIERFLTETDEKFILILLDKKYKEITEIEFTDNNINKVTAEIPEIAKALAIHKPAYTIAVHNHPSGVVDPSNADDITTKKINLLCEVHGSVLIDHVIVYKQKVFSYYETGRLDTIRKEADLKVILREQGDYLWKKLELVLHQAQQVICI